MNDELREAAEAVIRLVPVATGKPLTQWQRTRETTVRAAIDRLRAAIEALASAPSGLTVESLARALPYWRDNNRETCTTDARTILANLGAAAVVDAHPEATCQRCGRPNVPAWSAPDDLWNEVMGGEVGILCPPCFAEMANESRTIRWRFSPATLDDHEEPDGIRASLWQERVDAGGLGSKDPIYELGWNAGFGDAWRTDVIGARIQAARAAGLGNDKGPEYAAASRAESILDEAVLSGALLPEERRLVRLTVAPASSIDAAASDARPDHAWNDPDDDGHNCADCPEVSQWKCDRFAHVLHGGAMSLLTMEQRADLNRELAEGARQRRAGEASARNIPLGAALRPAAPAPTVDATFNDGHAGCRDELRLARDLAGHRIRDIHDCFAMNCRDLGDEVRGLYERLAIAAVPTVDAAALDAAWAEVETALPKTMWFDLEKRSDTGYNAVAFARSTGYGTKYARADTPAAALRALAAALRASARGGEG